MSEKAYPWEPSYGFSENDPVKLAAALEMVRRRICAYGPLAETCDCKFGIDRYILPAGDVSGYINHEQTGCPELRSVIHMLLHGVPPEADLEGGFWVRLTQDNSSDSL